MPKNNDMAPFIPLASTGDVRKVMEPLHHLIKALGYEWVPGGTAYTMGKLVKVKK
jgi:hypothetical protein